MKKKSKLVMNLPNGDFWVSEAGHYRCVGDLRGLPYVSDKYESVLKENYIPYRIFEQASEQIAGVTIYKKFCEYWNPLLFEEEEITLKEYVRIPDLSLYYKYSGKTFSSMAPTLETVRLAKSLEKFITQKIKDYDQQKHNTEMMAYFKLAKQELGNKCSKFCTSELLFNSTFDDIIVDKQHIKIFRLPNYLNHVILFDVTYASILNQQGKQIFLNVPHKFAGLIIGKNYRNIHLLEEELRVNKIHVIPM